jgi:hypothetical protein
MRKNKKHKLTKQQISEQKPIIICCVSMIFFAEIMSWLPLFLKKEFIKDWHINYIFIMFGGIALIPIITAIILMCSKKHN